MFSWLAPIIVFGLVVFVHELGHFIAAKLAGVYAPRFSIGFGPALWRKRWGETEYVLSALPLGGYVRMASKEDEAQAMLEGGNEEVQASSKDWDPNAMRPFGPREVPANRWFESKSLAWRLAILLAGVTMNAILAFVVSTGVFAAYGRPYLAPVVDSIVAGKPAAVGGLLKGDSVARVDGVAVRTWEDLVKRISAAPGRDLRFDIKRKTGETASVVVRPEAQRGTMPGSTAETTVGRIGVTPGDVIGREPIGFGDAVQSGWLWTAGNATAIVGVVRGLFGGSVSVKTLGGPIAIARQSVQEARNGFENLLLLIAFLSINLAVLNLLPIPILDGGNIVLNVLEAVRGKSFSLRTRENILKVGLAALLVVFCIVMYNDISRLAIDLYKKFAG